MSKNRQTCKEHFGVECAFQSKEVQEKCRQSIQDHFGVDHPMQSDEVKEGMRQRYRDKHGVDYAFQDPEVQAKINAKMQENYGVDWPMQCPELHAIMHQNAANTQKKNYFIDAIANFKTVTAMFSLDEYIEKSRAKLPLKWKCKACGSEFEQMLFRHGPEPRCFNCKPLIYNRVDSNEEIDLFNFVSSIDGSKYECLRHSYWNWNLLDNGKLLDIVCVNKETEKPEIAIEFDGIYWHSLMQKEIGYHLMKTKACEDKGIKLIHVWEDEWLSRQDEVKSFLSVVMKGEFCIDKSIDTLELNRSQVCKLWVPSCYEVEEKAPVVAIRTSTNRKTGTKKDYYVEDCGKLVLKRKATSV